MLHFVYTRRRVMLCGLALMLALQIAVNAQIGGGTVRGFITDASNATVPGAKIKAVNVDTNVPATTTSNDSGYYEFPLLPAGRYFVEAAREGFRPVRSEEF